MTKAENLLASLGVKNYTERHIKIIDDFLSKGKTDVKKLLDDLGGWDEDDLKIAEIWFKMNLRQPQVRYDKEILKDYLEAYLVEYLGWKTKDGTYIAIEEGHAANIADSIILDYEVHITGKL